MSCIFILGKCACNCGSSIPIRTKSGYLRRYINGHQIRGQNHPMWKGGEQKHDKRGYIKICIRGHPFSDKRGRIYKHRFIMEQYLGRYVKPEEVVHHLDKNPNNNEISNLQLFGSNGEHIAFHMTKDMSDRKCDECGSSKTYFRPDIRMYIWAFPDGRCLCRSCDRKRRWKLNKGINV